MSEYSGAKAASGEDAKDEAARDGYWRRAAHGRAVPELARPTLPPAVGCPVDPERAGVVGAGGERLPDDAERLVLEAAAARSSALAAGSNDHVREAESGPAGRRTGDLGRAYHRPARELGATDRHTRHIDEVGARDRDAGPSDDRASGGAHGSDPYRRRRRSTVLATGGYWCGQAADDCHQSTQCHTLLPLTDASAANYHELADASPRPSRPKTLSRPSAKATQRRRPGSRYWWSCRRRAGPSRWRPSNRPRLRW